MKNRNVPVTIGFILLGAAVIAVIIFLVKNTGKETGNEGKNSRIEIKGFVPTTIHEGKDSTLKIYGKNLLHGDSATKVEVFFAGMPASVHSAMEDTIIAHVNVAKVKEVAQGDPLRIPFEVRKGAMVLFSDTVACELDKEVVINDFDPKNFYTRPKVTFVGKNLDAEDIKVLIDRLPCTILTQEENKLMVQSPPIEGERDRVTVEVWANGKRVCCNEFGKSKFVYIWPGVVRPRSGIDSLKAKVKY